MKKSGTDIDNQNSNRRGGWASPAEPVERFVTMPQGRGRDSVGVGVILGWQEDEGSSASGRVLVDAVAHGWPASLCGQMAVGDTILSVDSNDVATAIAPFDQVGRAFMEALDDEPEWRGQQSCRCREEDPAPAVTISSSLTPLPSVFPDSRQAVCRSGTYRRRARHSRDFQAAPDRRQDKVHLWSLSHPHGYPRTPSTLWGTRALDEPGHGDLRAASQSL